MQVEQLIHARWIIPIEPEGQVLEDHTLAIDQGLITALLPSHQAREQIQARQVLELPGSVLLPGLVNAHTHSPMSLFRGLADDRPLMDWLQNHIWPAEQRWVSEQFVADGSRLAIAEMIRGGTTCFNDMYFFANATGEMAQEAGLRAVLGLIVLDFPSTWARDAAHYLERALALHDRFRHESLISTAFAPHAPYSVSDEPLREVAKFAAELDKPVHIHVHETQDEIQQSLETFGERPLQRLDRLGLVNADLIAVHMTRLTEAEIERVANSGASVVHCPESNLKLASGFCPAHELLQAGVNVALGTDGAASNNDLDMLSEMRSAALLGKGASGDPTALPAHQVIRMATLNGARALKLDEQIGSLQAGKSADLIAVDLDAIATQPVYDPASQLVYAAGREQVTHVWVAGQPLLAAGRLTTLDENAVLAAARHWRGQIHSQES